MPTNPISFFAWLALIGLSVLWGGTFFLAELALKEISPLLMVFHRCLWAALFLWGVIFVMGIAVPATLSYWASIFVMGVLNNALPFSLIFWGQQYIEGGLASILNATTAIFGALVAGIFLPDEKMTLRKVIGIIVGVVAVIIMMGHDAFQGVDLYNLGQYAVLLAAVSYAFASVWGKVKLNEKAQAIVNAAAMLSASAILMLPVIYYGGEAVRFNFGWDSWLVVIILAILCTAFAYLLYFWLLEKTGAANTMLVTIMIPPSAIFLGWLWLDEQLVTSDYVGFLCIVLALLILDGRIVDFFKKSFF